jgi:hypothetical protein
MARRRASWLEVAKQANAAYTGGSGLKTEGRVFQCDAAQCVDRSESGGRTCIAELGEALGRRDDPAINEFSKDRREQDSVYVTISSLDDLRQSMAGDGNHWRRQVC